jgi:helix-turn-helix protein
LASVFRTTKEKEEEEHKEEEEEESAAKSLTKTGGMPIILSPLPL